MAPVVLMGRPAPQTGITLKGEWVWVRSSDKAVGKAQSYLTGMKELCKKLQRYIRFEQKLIEKSMDSFLKGYVPFLLRYFYTLETPSLDR